MAIARRRVRTPPLVQERETHKKLGPSTTSAKVWLLGALLIQSCVQSLAARKSRTAAELRDQADGCGAPVAGSVVIIESIKATLCFVVLGWLEVRRGPMATLRVLARQTRANAKDALLILVPAVCYVVSNTLNLHAATYVEGPLLLVFGTSQILFVSLFSVAILRRRLSAQQWLALFILTAAVLCVQTGQLRNGRSKHAGLGLALAAFACAISSFASVFFELVLNHSAISLWVRNFHLAVLSLPFALLNLALHRQKLLRCGFFAGYGLSEWAFVFSKAIGGLIVAAVIKYADNILKCFASAGSVLLASVAATYDDFVLTPRFIGGAIGAIFAILLYGDALPHGFSHFGASNLRSSLSVPKAKRETALSKRPSYSPTSATGHTVVG